MEERYALLIDADNVSAKYIKPILDELSKYGNVTYKRIYGDWTSTYNSSWKEVLLQNSITPIQQFSYTHGKNATDSAMIIDAMDMLYTSELEGFCLVSSDSDFTKLASRLRESGKMVIGMGEDKTPPPFRKACDIFTVLELLLEDSMLEKPEKAAAHAVIGKESKKESAGAVSKSQIEEAVVKIITENQNNDKGDRTWRGRKPSGQTVPGFRCAKIWIQSVVQVSGNISKTEAVTGWNESIRDIV